MKAVRCVMCGLLVSPSNGYGNLELAIPGNHAAVEGEDGFAEISETPVCAGSEMLGFVEEITG